MAIFNSHKRPVFGPVFLFQLFFFFSLFLLTPDKLHAAEIKIAILDSSFCPELLSLPPYIKVEKVRDLTGTVDVDCKKFSVKELKESRRFHGHWVLQTFLKEFSGKHSLRIIPLNVFNQDGVQSVPAWEKALALIRGENIQLTISALGLQINHKLTSTLPGIWIVASGRVERGIKKEMTFFPQMLAPQENLLLIGDYFAADGKSDLYDQNLLYQDRIDYYIPDSNDIFRGTSYAVAIAGARALQFCADSLSGPQLFRECLKTRAIRKRDPLLRKDFLSF